MNIAADMLLMLVSLLFFKTDSSIFSDKKPRERKPELAPERKKVNSSVLKRNNSIKKAMRPDIEQAFVRKLEILGVKSVSSAGDVLKRCCKLVWEGVAPHCFPLMAPPGSGWPQGQRVELAAGQSRVKTGECGEGDTRLLACARRACSLPGAEAVQ